ncbi:MAG: MFS transporter [Pseudomonadota bacterium]
MLYIIFLPSGTSRHAQQPKACARWHQREHSAAGVRHNRPVTDANPPSAPLFSSRRMLMNFVLLVLCSQFAFSVLAMKGVLLPQMLELWQISKTQFGLLMTLYGVVHNVFYVALAWVQDRFSARTLIPINMILGGLTTFFLGTTADFLTLCFLFIMLSLWCEGAFWPAVLAAVRKTTADENQGKIFGLLEGGRGGVELLQNLLTIGLYTALGYSVLGLEIAFKVNALIMITLGVLAWRHLPKDTLLKAGTNARLANREVNAGIKTVLRLPEVWLAGLVGFTVYLAYTAMPFFITYLTEVHALAPLAVALFGIASTSGGRIGMALPSGFLANRFFGGAVGALRAGLAAVVLLALTMVTLSADRGDTWTALVTLTLMSLAFFFLRALYFAPYGEMGLPQRFSGSALAIAAFLIYLPSSFAYLLWGYVLDNQPGVRGYQFMFGVLACCALFGVAAATALRQRMRSGLRNRIKERIAAVDEQLGLLGQEKTLDGLIEQDSKEA